MRLPACYNRLLCRRSGVRGVRILVIFTTLGLAVLACNFPGLITPEKARGSNRTIQIPATTQEPVNRIASNPQTALLAWEGGLPGEPGSCFHLEVDSSNQAFYGRCGEEAASAPFNPPQWDEIVARFAPFEWVTADGYLKFSGQGYISGPAWERAIINWTEGASLSSGRTCSACSTLLTWSFGEVPGAPGSCAYLWATGYGYAYAGQAPCQGGQTQIISRGWLDTEEWVQLDAWLQARSELHLGETGASYLLGRGSQPMSAEEIDQLAEFAKRLNHRLVGSVQ